MKQLLFLLAFAISTCASAQPLKVYFGNLHSHTSLSDGRSTPDKAYPYAREVAKLDFLAVTEHNHRAAPSKLEDRPELYSGTGPNSLISIAKRFNEDNRFVAIYGQEFSAIGKGNHANVFEINKVIAPSLVPNGAWDKLMNDFLPQFKDSQGRLPILLLNHPSISGSADDVEYGRDDFGGDDRKWLETLDQYAHLMNIINGPSHHDTHKPGSPSMGEYLRYLNLGLHVAPTADQDNHLENWGNAANARTGVVTTSLTKQNIMNALRERNVYATQDKNLSIIGKVNGELMGKIFTGGQLPAEGSDLRIELTIKDTDEPQAEYTVYVYADKVGGDDVADVVYHEKFTGNGTFHINTVKYAGGRQYFFVKIKQSDDDGEKDDNAWLAPVWFEPGGSDFVLNSAPIQNISLNVDEVKEEAVITNRGTVAVNLKGWKLVSTVGNQEFKFENDHQLLPGKSIVVVSGPNSAGRNRVKWTDKYIWTNTGDPGKLLDKDGKMVAETGEH